MTENPKTGWEKFKTAVVVFASIVGGLATIFSVIYGIPAFIDNRINKVVQDDAYVRRIANEVRPSVVFDSHGSILVDQGAMRYLDDIVVLNNNTNEMRFPEKIIIKPKQHLSQAPLLTMIDTGTAMIETVQRGEKFDWVYTVEGANGLERDTYRFRLEVLP
jgi:hypothetical protein